MGKGTIGAPHREAPLRNLEAPLTKFRIKAALAFILTIRYTVLTPILLVPLPKREAPSSTRRKFEWAAAAPPAHPLLPPIRAGEMIREVGAVGGLGLESPRGKRSPSASKGPKPPTYIYKYCMAGETGRDREGPSLPGPINSISWKGPGGTQYITKWTLFTSF